MVCYLNLKFSVQATSLQLFFIFFFFCLIQHYKRKGEYSALKEVTYQSKHEVTMDFIQNASFSDELSGAEAARRDFDSRVAFWTALWSELSYSTHAQSALNAIDTAVKVANCEYHGGHTLHDQATGESQSGESQSSGSSADVSATAFVANESQLLQLAKKDFYQCSKAQNLTHSVHKANVRVKFAMASELFSDGQNNQDLSGNIQLSHLNQVVAEDLTAELNLPVWGNIVLASDDSVGQKQQALKCGSSAKNVGQAGFWVIPSQDYCLAWHVGTSQDSADHNCKFVEEKTKITVDGHSYAFSKFSIVPLTSKIGSKNVVLCREPHCTDLKSTPKSITAFQNEFKRKADTLGLWKHDTSKHSVATAKREQKHTGAKLNHMQ